MLSRQNLVCRQTLERQRVLLCLLRPKNYLYFNDDERRVVPSSPPPGTGPNDASNPPPLFAIVRCVSSLSRRTMRPAARNDSLPPSTIGTVRGVRASENNARGRSGEI